jgi:hypothetical protein
MAQVIPRASVLVHLRSDCGPPNKPLKLTAEQVTPVDPRRWSGYPGVGRPW